MEPYDALGCCGNPVLDRIARQTGRIMEVDRACVLVHDKDNLRSPVEQASYGLNGSGQRYSVDQGMVAQVLATGEPLSVRDYRQLFWPLPQRATDAVQAGGSVPINWGGRVRGVLSVATTDPSRPFGDRELDMLTDLSELTALTLQCSEQREQLESALQDGVVLLAAAVDLRDHGTARHSEHVVRLAVMVGEAFGLDDRSLRELTFAARLHDVGKIGVPDLVLRKPGPLNSEEWRVMQRHPMAGAEMLRRVPGLEGVAAIVRHHHEHFDGSGYPFGLQGEEIPIASRIISTCDAYDAMTSDRPYRAAMSHDVAVAELQSCCGRQFDPDAVDAVIEAVPFWLEREQDLTLH